MSRDLEDDYYITHGGVVPVKWTAPEVACMCVQCIIPKGYYFNFSVNFASKILICLQFD